MYVLVFKLGVIRISAFRAYSVIIWPINWKITLRAPRPIKVLPGRSYAVVLKEFCWLPRLNPNICLKQRNRSVPQKGHLNRDAILTEQHSCTEARGGVSKEVGRRQEIRGFWYQRFPDPFLWEEEAPVPRQSTADLTVLPYVPEVG